MAGAAEAVCGGWALARGTGWVAGSTDTGPDGLNVILGAVVGVKDFRCEAWWTVLDTGFLVQGEPFFTHCQHGREGKVLAKWPRLWGYVKSTAQVYASPRDLQPQAPGPRVPGSLSLLYVVLGIAWRISRLSCILSPYFETESC